MRLVSTEQGKVMRVYRGHSNKLYCCISTFITTLPQQAVACGSDDGSIFVWDVDSKQVRVMSDPERDNSSYNCCMQAFRQWQKK
jgi:WD40 repeat protein